MTDSTFHAAAHQQPQEFQVRIAESMSLIRTGKLRIRFFRYEGLPRVKTQPMKSFTGVLPVCQQNVSAESREKQELNSIRKTAKL